MMISSVFNLAAVLTPSAYRQKAPIQHTLHRGDNIAFPPVSRLPSFIRRPPHTPRCYGAKHLTELTRRLLGALGEWFPSFRETAAPFSTRRALCHRSPVKHGLSRHRFSYWIEIILSQQGGFVKGVYRKFTKYGFSRQFACPKGKVGASTPCHKQVFHQSAASYILRSRFSF